MRLRHGRSSPSFLEKGPSSGRVVAALAKVSSLQVRWSLRLRHQEVSAPDRTEKVMRRPAVPPFGLTGLRRGRSRAWPSWRLPRCATRSAGALSEIRSERRPSIYGGASSRTWSSITFQSGVTDHQSNLSKQMPPMSFAERRKHATKPLGAGSLPEFCLPCQAAS